MASKDEIDQEAKAAEWGLQLDGDVEPRTISPMPEDTGPASSPAAASSMAAGAWSSMVDETKTASKGTAERILNQEEIDALLGFSLADVSFNDNSGIRAIID